MGDWISYLRELNMASLLLRLILAMLCGGLLGLERGRKRRPAGSRTYMLVCLGAALTMVLSQYEYVMLTTGWMCPPNSASARMSRVLARRSSTALVFWVQVRS